MRESDYLHANEETMKTLLKIPTLRHFKNGLKDILHFSKIKQYRAGEYIIKEGEKDQWIFCLITGTVDVIKKDHKISTLFTGDIFGEMSVVDGSARSASVLAVTDTICLAYNAALMNDSAGNNNEMLLFILYRIFAKMLADRLRQSNEALVEARREVARLKGEDESTVVVDELSMGDIEEFFPDAETFLNSQRGI